MPGGKPRATGKPAPGKRTDAGGQPATDEQVGPKSYKRYTVEIANRSITAPETREQIWQLLKELSKVVDPANSDLDHQLLNLTLTLTTAEGDQAPWNPRRIRLVPRSASRTMISERRASGQINVSCPAPFPALLGAVKGVRIIRATGEDR